MCNNSEKMYVNFSKDIIDNESVKNNSNSNVNHRNNVNLSLNYKY